MQEPSDFQGSSKSRQSPFIKNYSTRQLWVLESYFKMDGYPSNKDMEGLAARLHLKEDQVSEWFSRRREAFFDAGFRRLQGCLGPTEVGCITYYRRLQEELLRSLAGTRYALRFLEDSRLENLQEELPCNCYLLPWVELGDGARGDAAWPRGSPCPAPGAASPSLPAALDTFRRLLVSDSTP